MRPNKRQKTASLALEQLGDRINPAVTIHGFVATSATTFVYDVTTDNAVNNITLTPELVGSTGVRITESGSAFNVLVQDSDISLASIALGSFSGFRINTGTASDTVNGSTLAGNPNYKMIVNAGNGNNTVMGGAYDDIINTGTGNDIILGGGGNDTVNSGSGNDSVNGGDGNDTINTGDGTDVVNGDGGNDIIDTGAGDDNVNGGTGNDTINAGTGNDTANGGDGDDTINGGDGDDVLTGGAGKDAMHGGDGDDIVNSDTADYVGGASISGGTNNPSPPNNPDVLNIDSSTGDNISYTNSGFERINGDDGNESIRGDDTLNDEFLGNAGNDTFIAGPGADGNDTFNGGAGSDTIDYSNKAGAVIVVVNSSGPALLGGDASGDSVSFVENATGGAGDDLLHGDGGANTLIGNAGDDTLVGNAGNDILSGGLGNDELTGGAGNDDMSGGDGDDDMVGGNGGDTMSGGAGNDNMEGGRGADTMNGNSGNDFVEGNRDADTIAGGTGNDVVDGGLGNDIFILDVSPILGDPNTINPDAVNLNDQYWGGQGADTYRAYNAWDTLTVGMLTFQVLNPNRVNGTNDYVSALANAAPAQSDFTIQDTVNFILTPLPAFFA